jgi:uracil permease
MKPEPRAGNREPGAGGTPGRARAAAGIEFLYGPDDAPPASRLLAYGFQWVLVAIGPITLFVPVISTYLHLTPDQTVAYVQRMLLLTGLMTLIQNLWGHRYPLQDGPAGAMLLALVAVAPEGPAAVHGGLIVGGIAGGLVAATGLMRRLARAFTPNITGVVLMLVALSLVPAIYPLVGGITRAHPAGEPSALVLALLVALGIPWLSYRLRGFAGTVAILLGIAGGSALAWLIGRMDLGIVAAAPWLLMPLPPDPGGIAFTLGAAVSFPFAFLAVLVNTVGSLYGAAEILGASDMEGRVGRGVFWNGAGNVLAGLGGSLGTVTFSMGVGVMLATRVAARRAQVACALMLVGLAFVPRLAAVLAAVPPAVVGGAFIATMSTQIGVGMQAVFRGKERLTSRDYFVVGVPTLLGTLMPILPPAFYAAFPSALAGILRNGMVVGILTVLLLEHVLLPDRRRL